METDAQEINYLRENLAEVVEIHKSLLKYYNLHNWQRVHLVLCRTCQAGNFCKQASDNAKDIWGLHDLIRMELDKKDGKKNGTPIQHGT